MRWLLLIFLLCAARLGAQAGDVLVNDDKTGGCEHNHASVTFINGGRFLAVWHDYRMGDYDANIYCQAFDSLGQKLGRNWRINEDPVSREYLNYRQLDPAIATTPDGPSVACWEDYRDGESHIYYQPLDTGGAPVGHNLRAMADTNTQLAPCIAGMGAGFVMAWELHRDSVHTMLWSTLLDSLGDAGPDFRIDDDVISESSEAPSVAGFDSGFVAAWCQLRNYGNQPERTIRLRWFDARGNPRGGSRGIPFRNIAHVRVAADQAGNCIIVWDQEQADRIWAEAFDSTGRSLGSPFALNNANSIWGLNPTIAAIEEDSRRPSSVVRRPSSPVNFQFPISNFQFPMSTGATAVRYLVAWEDLRRQQPRVLIYAQLLDRFGTSIGNNFPFDSVAKGFQAAVGVAMSRRPSSIVRRPSSPANFQFPVSSSASAVSGLPSGYAIAAVWSDTREPNRNIYGSFFAGCTTRFRVDDDVASSLQDYPVITLDGQGRSSLFWYDFRNNSDIADVYGQRFDSSMQKIGGNFRVNDALPNTGAYFLWAATSAAGRTVVAWEDYREITHPAIYAQIYDSIGAPVGPNLRISDNYFNDSSESWPYVSMNDAGNCVVAWTDVRNGPEQPFVQVLDRNGERIGNNFVVDTTGLEPGVWLTPQGTFYTVWRNDGGVWLRRVGPDLKPDRLMIHINADTTRTLASPKLVGTSLGTLWVVWMDGSRGKWDVCGQRVASSGWPIGHNIRINDDKVLCDHILPEITGDGRDRIYVTWTDFRIAGEPDVRCQVFDTSGAALDTNFIVNGNPRPGIQHWAYGSVAARNGRIVFTWLDNRNARSFDVYARKGTPSEQAVFRWRSLYVMPSVVHGQCWVKPAIPVGGFARLRVYDAAGRMRRDLAYSGAQAESGFTLDCRDLPSGVYIARLSSGSVILMNKFVVAR